MKTMSLVLVFCGFLVGCGPRPAEETPVTPAPTVVPSPTISPTPTAASATPVTAGEGAAGPIVTPGETNRDKALITEPPSDAVVTPGSSPKAP